MRAEAVRTLYLQMRTQALSTIVVTLYMAGTALPYTAWRVVASWAGVQLVTQIGREMLIRAWRRRPREDGELAPWAQAYTLYMVATGGLWGSTIFLFAHPDQPITVALTMCCLYAIAAGSTPSNAYNPPGLYALVGVMFAQIVVRLFWTGRLEYVLLGVASGLYAVAMSAMCRTTARTLNEGFRIRFENRELLEAVTVQKAEAEAARHQAERASLAKSQFLAAASHDLRQPLYALSLFSASLETLRLDADGRAVVGRIQDSVQAMEQLFDGLLDLSKLDAGVVQPRLGAVSVDALFDRLSQYFYPIAAARGLELRLRSDGEWVNSDAVLLEQVLGNLLSNAIRNTTQGGVLVAARRRRSCVRLEVWDTGIGIARADLTRIFEEFVQVGAPEGGTRRGLGLGLSIARRSGALIGAVIDVASRPGRGSRFALSQPVAQPAALAEPARAVPVPDGFAHAIADLAVLIVDDDDAVRLALADLLARWKVRADTAASAAAALALIESGRRYSLVLTDFELGDGLNGLELIGAIDEIHQGERPSSALITANFEPELISAAGDRGIKLLHKPVQPTELMALLHRSAKATAPLPMNDGGSGGDGTSPPALNLSLSPETK